jgi:hypothetical protein
VIPESYNALKLYLKGKVSQVLSECESISFTSDCWTSKNASKSLMAFTLHCIDQECNLFIVTLGVLTMHGAHTHNLLQDKFNEILEEFSINISQKPSYMVTDNGSNIKKAFTEMEGIERISCMAHNLQLCIVNGKKSCTEMSKLSSAASALVTKFNHSHHLQEKLVKAQEQLGMVPPKKFVKAVDTRWGSEFAQIQRILELKSAIKQMEDDLGFIPFTVNDYKLMQQVLLFSFF